jgi:Ca-activated chloride channel family protein
MNLFGAFHFIRPAWLLLLLPVVLLLWAMMRRQDPVRGLKAVVSPELLEHLVLPASGQRGRLRPVFLLAAIWLLSVVALAGPAWQKEQAPFSEDRSALVIVMKVTPTMQARDIQPSRLERAVQKTGDLLAMRPGSRTGLVAYAGTAHLVMPLTDDAEVIRYFASELEPGVMPEQGDDPVTAVALAADRLSSSGLAGSIVLVADRVDPVTQDGLARVHRESGIDIHVYAIAAGADVVPPAGSPPAPFLEEDAMRTAARAGGGSFVAVTPDDSDLRQLASRIERSIATASIQEGERWKDAGYWLLWPLMLIFLLFWRRGGAVPLGLNS